MTGEELAIEEAVNAVCPLTGEPVRADALARYRDRVVGFARAADRDMFATAIAAFDKAIAEEETPLIARGRD